MSAGAQAALATPLDGAAAIARALRAAAIRHGGRCTWVAEEAVAVDGTWRAGARTLPSDLGWGDAGVGWFLARATHATGDDALADVAVEALRRALEGADALRAAGRIGFHDGALGVAWAAVDAGRTLGVEELVAAGATLTGGVAAGPPARASSPALVGGDAGTLAGFVVLAQLLDDAGLLERAAELVPRLRRITGRLVAGALAGDPPWSSDRRSFVGLADGASGLALPLLAFARSTGDSTAYAAAADAALAERAWYSGPDYWVGAPHHGWLDPGSAACSWCSGAAGIGHARLLAHAVTGDLQALAELAAAIELVRGAVATGHPADPSICHGVAGWLELLQAAGVALGEPSHLEAARRIGERLLRDAGASDLGAAPALFSGAAGVGLTLLRLDDPFVPSPANPFVAPTP